MKSGKSLRRLLVPILLTPLLFIGCEKYGAGTTDNLDPVVTDKGTPVGEATSGTIDQNGGELLSSDGKIGIAIPAGALSGPTLISIQPVTGEAPLGLGMGYRLLPVGQTFTKPVKLTFTFDNQLLQNSPADFLWIVTQTSTGSWNALMKSVLDENSGSVSCETTHFSDWALARFIQLSITPAQTLLKKGESVQLKLIGFVRDRALTGEEELVPLVPITTDDDVLTPLTPIPPVESRLMDIRVKQWAMNGSPAPVSNTNGSLTGKGNSATYKAPNKKPSTNPVAVSASLETTNKEGKKSTLTVVSNIFIVESDLYLSLTVDGQSFLYYQYGFNAATPDDPNNYLLVNCGLSDGILGISAMEIFNASGMRNGLTLTFGSPAAGSRSMTCKTIASDDDMNFSFGMDGSSEYTFHYEKRTLNADDICETEWVCGDITFTLSAYEGTAQSEVAGTFSGTLFEDKPNYAEQCKMPDAHSIQGEFRLVIAGI